MSRRQRDKRTRERAARDRSESQAEERLIHALRQIQLASAAVMLVGVTTATLVCAGEFRMPWLVAAGVGTFVIGLALYGVARPLARWWATRA